ncbi:hypothetical protein G6661_01755 [Polynucleobacter paneuropaeus]|nr:hypothetical protein G6661_01755 [Polynucleobacter paneuropaeus]
MNKYKFYEIEALIALASLGLHIFLFGWHSLNPYNISWLLDRGDVTANLIGNLFFSEQKLGVPLLLNRAYGLNGGTLLFFSGTPINGVILRVIDYFTGLGFYQLIGFWLLLCSFLFFIYAYRLIFYLSSEKRFSFLGALLLWTTPFFWDRSDRHVDLFGQWILIATIYYILSERGLIRIYGLVAFSLLVTPYYLPMILMLMVILRKFNIALIWDIAKISILSCLFLFGLGIGGAKRFSDAGFGLFKANLLTWVDSNSLSLTLPDLPSHIGENEGYGYIGLPFLFLFIVTFFLLLKDLASKKNYLARAKHLRINFIFALLVFMVAISTTIGVGSANFELLDSKNSIFRFFHDDIFSIFRVTGRFIWVPTYLLLITVLCYLISRNRSFSRWCIVIAIFLTIDNYPLYKSIQDFYGNNQLDSAAQIIISGDQKKYSTIYVYPSTNGGKNWEYYALGAFNMGASTNSILVARYDTDGYRKLDEETMKRFLECNIDKDTLYYVDPQIYKKVMEAGCSNSPNVREKVF